MAANAIPITWRLNGKTSLKGLRSINAKIVVALESKMKLSEYVQVMDLLAGATAVGLGNSMACPVILVY